ncbi:ATP-binding protein [Draconibacterium halophilum]|uniref:ATP-binding protein n=1 Tax=Draconibacterium halophilum TaxID=2706887 RepID=UPI001FEC6A81|nr:ATP-binding protein [Draconibacterium halophilum]
MSANYDEATIKTLDWQEHIRRRPGMYIGKLGDGTSADDGIYVLLKEVMDNSVDEFMMGHGKRIVVNVDQDSVTIRDFGRGVPLGKLVDVASKMNTGAKYDNKVFKKSVGLNGVGIKAVNALSSDFMIKAVREGVAKEVYFSQGVKTDEKDIKNIDEENGTQVTFIPDESVFKKYRYMSDYIVNMMKNYTFLNAGLTIEYNGDKFYSRNGLRDLLEENMDHDPIYPIIHLRGEDIEVAITHGNQYGEDYYSFVNGQHTTQGGTHLQAFREVLVKTIRDFYKKDFDPSDIRASIVAAVSIKVEEPVFESQTKTKLGSKDIGPEGPSVRAHVGNFLQKELDNFLHKNQETAEMLLKRIVESERERKAISGVKKLARQRAKKANLHNKNCAIAVFISIVRMIGKKNRAFLLQRETRQVDRSQNHAM